MLISTQLNYLGRFLMPLDCSQCPNHLRPRSVLLLESQSSQRQRPPAMMTLPPRLPSQILAIFRTSRPAPVYVHGLRTSACHWRRQLALSVGFGFVRGARSFFLIYHFVIPSRTATWRWHWTHRRQGANSTADVIRVAAELFCLSAACPDFSNSWRGVGRRRWIWTQTARKRLKPCCLLTWQSSYEG